MSPCCKEQHFSGTFLRNNIYHQTGAGSHIPPGPLHRTRHHMAGQGRLRAKGGRALVDVPHPDSHTSAAGSTAKAAGCCCPTLRYQHRQGGAVLSLTQIPTPLLETLKQAAGCRCPAPAPSIGWVLLCNTPYWRHHISRQNAAALPMMRYCASVLRPGSCDTLTEGCGIKGGHPQLDSKTASLPQ